MPTPDKWADPKFKEEVLLFSVDDEMSAYNWDKNPKFNENLEDEINCWF